MSNNVFLRAIEPSDLDLLYRYENDKEVWRVSGTTLHFSRYTLKKYIENSFIDIFESKQLRLIIMCGERAVGSVDIFDFDPLNSRSGIGIIIYDKADRQKGIASRALDLLEDYCFNTLALHQIYCNISCNNHNSLALFKKKNFVVVGTKKEWTIVDGEFCDEILLQKINKKADKSEMDV